MGKSGGLILVAMTALLIASCGEPVSNSTARDLLFLRSPRGVAVTAAGASAPVFRGAGAVPSRDWSAAVSGYSRRGATRVVARNPASGAKRWVRTVAGYLRVKVVSEDGGLVALGPWSERYYRDGRRETKLVIAGSRTLRPRRITLDGNYEPEAFSTDGKSLFVISYLPARKPTAYQVRRLDLTTGRVHDVYTPDAHLQKAMGGTARIQAASPDGRRLYTLYTLPGPEGGEDYAFIHVLSLDELWAHCIDLPPGFATSAESATALTVSADGSRLYVTNGATKALAEIDTEALRVVRTSALDLGSVGVVHGAHDSDSTLYLARGRRVVALDASDLTQLEDWVMPEKVRGLQVTPDAKRLYIGLSEEVAVIDTMTRLALPSIDPAGVRWIDEFGPVTRSLEPTLDNITCAC
jgi:hypothetical protein